MIQKIGPREQALREAREKQAKDKPVGFAKIVKETLAAKLPETTGRKPAKRKAKKARR